MRTDMGISKMFYDYSIELRADEFPDLSVEQAYTSIPEE